MEKKNVSIKKMHIFVCIAVLTVVLGFATFTNAALVTEMSTSSMKLDFNQFNSSQIVPTLPQTLNIGAQAGENITITGEGSTFYTGNWGLNGNGSWGSDGNNGRGTWIGTQSGGGGAIIDFVGGTVNAVGAFMNYSVPNSSYITIGVFGVDHVLLESYELQTVAPISTPNTYNAGAFRGIIRPTNDIHAIGFSGTYMYVDDLQFSRVAPVPIPAAVWLFGSGLIGLFGIRRRFMK